MIQGITQEDTVYIAGPMTGLPGYNRAAFFAMQKRLEAQGVRRILNPARQPDGLTHTEYMRRGLADLTISTAVVFIKGWDDSDGAVKENTVARMLGLGLHRERGAACPDEALVTCAQTARRAFTLRAKAA